METSHRPANPLTPEAALACGRQLEALLGRLERVLIGQRGVLEELLIALLAGGHALVEGVPGVGKTLAAAAMARALGVRAGRVQFTPDLMPSDVTGVNVLLPGEGRFEFRPGPLFADVVLADEINRAPAKTQSALLEAMAERRVTVDGVSHGLGPLFTVFATQNPIEYEGTYPLPEAQLDRFLLRVRVAYPSEQAEIDLLAASLAGFEAEDPLTFGLGPALSSEQVIELRRSCRSVHAEPVLLQYIVALVRATRQDADLSLGASPRSAVALLRASQGAALLAGRSFATPEDVVRVAGAVLGHRLSVRPEAALEGIGAEQRIQAVLTKVPSPR